ncbi:MAG: hypothetical protein WAO95_08635 [Burkholderiales bacterium]
MKRTTLDDYYNNPEHYRRLAQRERARAIRQAFAWLGRHIAPRFESGPRQWMERLG